MTKTEKEKALKYKVTRHDKMLEIASLVSRPIRI
jgi:hypothetical protein